MDSGATSVFTGQWFSPDKMISSFKLRFVFLGVTFNTFSAGSNSQKKVIAKRL